MKVETVETKSFVLKFEQSELRNFAKTILSDKIVYKIEDLFNEFHLLIHVLILYQFLT